MKTSENVYVGYSSSDFALNEGGQEEKKTLRSSHTAKIDQLLAYLQLHY